VNLAIMSMITVRSWNPTLMPATILSPPGTHFDGAQMPYCMHLNGGYARHEGYVPCYAASHGCIRLPKRMAEHFFDTSREGTPVIVKE